MEGVNVLGVPIGQREYVCDFLERRSREQEVHFHKISPENDRHAAYHLLLMSGSTRANFWLRAARPEDTEAFATRHDENVRGYLRGILGMQSAAGSAQQLSTLALSTSGLELTFVSSCAGVCAFPFSCPCAPADATDNLTGLATIKQRVQWQGFGGMCCRPQ